MQPAEAFEWAADYAERAKLFEPVLNSRGYPDGWKPPTPAEKLDVIKRLAESVISGDADPRFEPENIFAYIETMFRQHTGGTLPAPGGTFRYAVHQNFLQEVREHFLGR